MAFSTGTRPHIIFSGIAATRWDWQRLNLGNIRHGVLEDGVRDIATIYRQPLPTGFFRATEMLWMCLVVSDRTNKIHIIGQDQETHVRYVYLVVGIAIGVAARAVATAGVFHTTN
ncbi:MAG: hypothetical protein OEW00_10640 [candidate division Zixibacteria bacterium]|nr:hypothetical protein [candidate division Zixibacteria bacterium]